MNKLISFSFKKIYFLIIILGIIDSTCFIVRHEYLSKYHQRRKYYSFIIQISSYLASIFCLIPYLYIRYKTKNKLKDKQKKEILNQLKKKLKYIKEKLKMLKEKKLEIFIIIFSISFINFFCNAQYLNMNFYIKNLFIFEYNYHEFYFISFFILFKFFFNFTFYNLYKLCLIISIFSSLLTLISLSIEEDNKFLKNLEYLYLIIIYRFLMSFVYCCYKYLMIYYFLNGYFIIFSVGCLSSFLYFFYKFFLKENYFYFEDKKVYLYLFINFINNFIQQILLIKLIDKLNPLFYCLSNFISSLIKIFYHIIFTDKKLDLDIFFFRLFIIIINIINGLIYCEIIQINICNLNYYCRIELEKIAKEEQKEIDNSDSDLELNKI